MILEDRIVKRWQEWWEKNIVTPPNLSEESMRALINIAMEEAQKGMCESRFTTQEAIQIYNLVSVLKAATNSGFPALAEGKIPILRNLVTPEILSAAEKIAFHLEQAQEMTAGTDATDATDTTDAIGAFREIHETHKNCPVCQKPIPASRKYCSVQCSNKAQGRKSAKIRKINRKDGDE